MPIIELTSDRISQHCAGCATERMISFNELAVGMVRQDVVNPYIIALPVCTGCGSREFLVRTPEAKVLERVRQGSYGHLHRLLVDRLHHLLVQGRRIAHGADPLVFERLPRTDVELERWLPGGWTLPVSPE